MCATAFILFYRKEVMQTKLFSCGMLGDLSMPSRLGSGNCQRALSSFRRFATQFKSYQTIENNPTASRDAGADSAVRVRRLALPIPCALPYTLPLYRIYCMQRGCSSHPLLSVPYTFQTGFVYLFFSLRAKKNVPMIRQTTVSAMMAMSVTAGLNSTTLEYSGVPA